MLQIMQIQVTIIGGLRYWQRKSKKAIEQWRLMGTQKRPHSTIKVSFITKIIRLGHCKSLGRVR